MCTVGIGSLCTLILCSYALGQAQPPAESDAGAKPAAQTPTKVEPRSKADSDTKAGPNTPTKRRPSAATRPGARAVNKPARPDARRPAVRPNKRASAFQMDPNAKFACDNATVTLEPVWRNGKDLTFPFKIRNDGTADLQIQAKGG